MIQHCSRAHFYQREQQRGKRNKSALSYSLLIFTAYCLSRKSHHRRRGVCPQLAKDMRALSRDIAVVLIDQHIKITCYEVTQPTLGSNAYPANRLNMFFELSHLWFF